MSGTGTLFSFIPQAPWYAWVLGIGAALALGIWVAACIIVADPRWKNE